MKSSPRNDDDLLENEVKNRKGLLLDIEMDEVPLILETSCGISNLRNQGSTEEAVKGEQLWQEVLDLRRTCLGARSIHELHFLQLEYIIGMNPRLRLHGQLVLKPKHPGKTVNHALILLPSCHPHQLLSSSIKVEGSIKLTNEFLIPIILEAHHQCHL
jgi:hypothetical protein